MVKGEGWKVGDGGRSVAMEELMVEDWWRWKN